MRRNLIDRNKHKKKDCKTLVYTLGPIDIPESKMS